MSKSKVNAKAMIEVNDLGNWVVNRLVDVMALTVSGICGWVIGRLICAMFGVAY